MKTRRALSRICSIEYSCLLSLFIVFCTYCSASDVPGLPQVATVLEPPVASSGAPLHLLISIAWQGDADAYIIIPPEPVLPEGLRQVASSFSSSARSDGQQLSYRFVLRADKQGDYTLQPLEIKYWTRGAEQESSLQTEALSCRVVKFAFFEQYRSWFFAGAALSFVLILLAAAGIAQRQRRRPRNSPLEDDTRARELAGQLRQCRDHKLQGDHSGFYRCALALVKQSTPEDKNLIDNLSAMLEKVQFSGRRPPAEELDRIYRQLEKRAGGPAAANKGDESEYLKYCK